MEFKEFKEKMDFQNIKDRIYKNYGSGIDRKLFESLQCGGSSIPDTQTTVSEPWSAQKPHLQKIYRGAEDFFDEGGADLFQDPFTAERDPFSLTGEQSIFDYIYGDQFGGVGEAAGTATEGLVSDPYGGVNYGDLTSDPSQYGMTSPEQDVALNQMMSGDPFRNPYTTQVADAFTQDMLETYNRDIAPGIRSAQIAYQPGGSSRGELVNARAEDDLNENILNVRSGFFNDAYNRALDTQPAGVGLYTDRAGLGEAGRKARAGEGVERYGAGIGGFGDLSDTLIQGYGTTAAIGEDRRNFEQQLIDEEAFRFDYDENRDFYNLQDYQSFFSPGFGGTQSTSFDSGVSDLQAALTGGGGLLSILMGMS